MRNIYNIPLSIIVFFLVGCAPTIIATTSNSLITSSSIVSPNLNLSVSYASSQSGTLTSINPYFSSLTYSIVSNPTHGTVVLTNASTGTYTYTANSGTGGTDTFSYKATDGLGNVSNIATVTVTIATSLCTPTKLSFSTVGSSSFQLPAACAISSDVYVKMWGGGGGGGTGAAGSGGGGGYSFGKVTLSQSQVYTIYVGGGGQDGNGSGPAPILGGFPDGGKGGAWDVSGGGGGGRSAFRNSVGDLIDAAGGGGGARPGYNGGAAGGTTGTAANGSPAGGGASSSSGGANCLGFNGYWSSAGGQFQGGNGATDAGAGGGGGYWGGGGGCMVSFGWMSGAGGGSSYIGGTGVSNASTTGGSGVTPGNATDSDNTISAGYGGGPLSNGNQGLVVIYYGAIHLVSISPSSGSTSGGTVVTLTGLGFNSSVSVTVGGIACNSISVSSANQLTCTTPAGISGASNIVVSVPGEGTATLANGFTYF